MILFSIVLIVFVALLLVLSVLAQSPKGGGLSAQFGGSSAARLMGSERTASLIEKVTWGLAFVLFISTVGFNMFLGTGEFQEAGKIGSPNVERAQQEQAVDPQPEEIKVGVEGDDEEAVDAGATDKTDKVKKKGKRDRKIEKAREKAKQIKNSKKAKKAKRVGEAGKPKRVKNVKRAKKTEETGKPKRVKNVKRAKKTEGVEEVKKVEETGKPKRVKNVKRAKKTEGVEETGKPKRVKNVKRAEKVKREGEETVDE